MNRYLLAVPVIIGFICLLTLAGCASMKEDLCRDPIHARLFPESCKGITPHTVQVTSDGKTVLVEADPELSRQLDNMNIAARSRQNARLFSRYLQQFEESAGTRCVDVIFERLEEPGRKRFFGGIEYIMQGKSQKCGDRTYRAVITFSDSHNTVAKSVDIKELIEGK